MTMPLNLSPIPVLLKTEEGLVPERPNLWLDGVLGAPKARTPGGPYDDHALKPPKQGCPAASAFLLRRRGLGPKALRAEADLEE